MARSRRHRPAVWFASTARGTFAVDLPEMERRVLGRLPAQLRELLTTDDPALVRLFPTAYHQDPEKDAEFHRLMRDDLMRRHQESLQVLEDTIGLDELTEDQLHSWMRAINGLRLVFGTKLDVSEETDLSDVDPDHPQAAWYAAYGYLGLLLEQIIAALAGDDLSNSGVEPDE